MTGKLSSLVPVDKLASLVPVDKLDSLVPLGKLASLVPVGRPASLVLCTLVAQVLAACSLVSMASAWVCRISLVEVLVSYQVFDPELVS